MPKRSLHAMKRESFAPAFWYPITKPLDNAWDGCTTNEKKRKSHHCPKGNRAAKFTEPELRDWVVNLSW
jgi:hypothetical protein